MKAQIRSESYKLVTTRTSAGIAAAMLGLVALAVVLHAFGLPVDALASASQQRDVLTDVGINLGLLFAALLGALSITSEFRTGTIRPTLLVAPRRARVIGAKTVCALAAGAATGLLAAGTAAAAGGAALAVRGVGAEVPAAELARVLAGATAAGALWAVIGLGVGAVLRAQVPVVVGLFAWVLFVEQVLGGDFPSAHRFVPGALAQALAGSTRDGVLSPTALAAVLLVAYAAAAALAGLVAMQRRDVA